MPTPAAMAAARRPERWHRLPITIYGRSLTTLVFTSRGLWYTALRDQPIPPIAFYAISH